MSTKICDFSKRLLGVILCLSVLATTFFIFDPMSMVASAADVSVWDGTAANGDANIKVDGTVCNIYTAKGLAYFRNNPGTYANKTVKLQTDIDLNGNSYNWGGIPSFTGTFDGNGHTISNMKISDNATDRGFFQILTANVNIKNLKFRNAQITSNYCSHGIVVGWARSGIINFENVEVYDSTVKGNQFVGGLVGSVNTTTSFTNCKYEWTGTGNLTSSTAIVENSNQYTGGLVGKIEKGGTATAPVTFNNCSVIAKILPNAAVVGGLIGYHTVGDYIKFENCTSRCYIDATGKNFIGGIIGSSNGYVAMSDCTNLGNTDGYYGANVKCGGFSGGLAGKIANIFTRFERCYNYVDVNGTDGYVGGLVGHLLSSSNSSFNSCENHGAITCNGERVGGIVGCYESNSSILFTNCNNSKNVTGTKFTGGFVGLSCGPINAADSANSGNITATIGEQAGGFAGHVDDGGCNFTNCINNGNVKTPDTADCAAGFIGRTNDGSGYGSVWSFTYCINNGKISGKSLIGGFFGYLGADGDDPKAYFKNCVNNGEIIGNQNEVGGFIGKFYSDGKLKFEDCQNNGYIHMSGTDGDQIVGGFVGVSIGDADEFTDCANTADVISNGKNNIHDIAATKGFSTSGGMIGYKSEANDVTFNHCYNTGNITAYLSIGGLIGDTDGNVTATNSYNIGAINSNVNERGKGGGIAGVVRGSFIADKCFNGNGKTGGVGSPSITLRNAGGLAGTVKGSSTLLNCYNNASIYATTTDVAYAGGLIGLADNTVTADYCYNAGNVFGFNVNTISCKFSPVSKSTCYYLWGINTNNGTPVSLKQLTSESDILNILPDFVSDKSGSNSYYHTLSCYKEDFHNIEIAGRLNYADSKSIAGYATVDVYINGALVADDCTEFSEIYPVGTTYEIKDFKLTDNTKIYNGLVADPDGYYNGLTGTVEKTSPEIMGAKFDISNAISGIDAVALQDETSYYIYANIEPADDIIRVQMHTWTEDEGQDDELPDWQTNNLATAAKGSWTVDGKTYNYRYQLNTALHGGEVNGWYNTQIVAFDRDNRQHDLFQLLRYRFQFTADFDSNGGSSVDSITRYCGDALDILPIPTRTGYTFVGWFTKAVSGQEITAETPMNFGDITYYAHWTPNRYTITFDTTGGSAVNPITQDFDSVINPPANPTRLGYTFVGWDKEIPETMPNENITITAIWSANTYTATFNANGGTDLSFQSITREYNQALGELPTVSREGYTFNGWYSESYGGNQISENTTMPSWNVNYYAIWTINKYTITFDTAGGTTLQPIIRNYGSTLPTIPKPRMSGYTFVGWDKEIPLTMPAEDFTLTAIWTPNNYTVNFMPNGGNVSYSSKAVTYDSTYGELPTPTWKDHVFLGWYTLASGGEQITPETTVKTTATQTLYAQWHSHNYINGACECGEVIYSLKSGAVIDNGLIYGLNANMNAYSFAKYFSFTQGYSLSVVKAENGYGTGTKLKIKDEDDNVIETLYAVVFGDINGDSVYDGMDSIVVSCIANGMLTREQAGEAVWLAADCNHDGVIDSYDVELLKQAGLILAEIQQSEDVIETLSLQSEYETLISQTIPTQEEPHKNPINFSKIFQMIYALMKGIFMKVFINN